MNWCDGWSSWWPPVGTEDPDQSGGISQLEAYGAGLTDDPGSWVQPIKVYWARAWTRGARSSSRGSRGRSPALTETGRNWNLGVSGSSQWIYAGPGNRAGDSSARVSSSTALVRRVLCGVAESAASDEVRPVTVGAGLSDFAGSDIRRQHAEFSPPSFRRSRGALRIRRRRASAVSDVRVSGQVNVPVRA
jgi:hypothetical protein